MDRNSSNLAWHSEGVGTRLRVDDLRIPLKGILGAEARAIRMTTNSCNCVRHLIELGCIRRR